MTLCYSNTEHLVILLFWWRILTVTSLSLLVIVSIFGFLINFLESIIYHKYMYIYIYKLKHTTKVVIVPWICSNDKQFQNCRWDGGIKAAPVMRPSSRRKLYVAHALAFNIRKAIVITVWPVCRKNNKR